MRGCRAGRRVTWRPDRSRVRRSRPAGSRRQAQRAPGLSGGHEPALPGGMSGPPLQRSRVILSVLKLRGGSSPFQAPQPQEIRHRHHNRGLAAQMDHLIRSRCPGPACRAGQSSGCPLRSRRQLLCIFAGSRSIGRTLAPTRYVSRQEVCDRMSVMPTIWLPIRNTSVWFTILGTQERGANEAGPEATQGDGRRRLSQLAGTQATHAMAELCLLSSWPK